MPSLIPPLLFLTFMTFTLSIGYTTPTDEHNSHGVPLKKSFSLRQGKFSALKRIAVGKNGYLYAAGFSDENCIILKIDTDLQSLEKMVRFGSSQGGGYFSQDTITDMQIDSNGNLFVVGYTDNQDFPRTANSYNSPRSKHASSMDKQGFVTKFSPDLKVIASSVIGGLTNDTFHSIAIDKDDNIYIAGASKGSSSTYRKSFTPPTKCFDKTVGPGGQKKGLIIKMPNDLSSLLHATLLGGEEKDYKAHTISYDITLDNDGNVWVTGHTWSDEFPVTYGTIGQRIGGQSDIFISKFNPELTQLLTSTLLGGRKKEKAKTIILDDENNVYVGGWSESADILLFSEGFDTEYSGNEEDGIVIKLDKKLEKIQSATFVGGNYAYKKERATKNIHGDDKVSSLTLSKDGKTLYVAGRTESLDFPTTPPGRVVQYGTMPLNVHFDRGKGDNDDSDYGDGFLVRYNKDLTTCFSSHLFGGSSLEYIDDLLLHKDSLYIVGETDSVDFPGMSIPFNITATRGFISQISHDISKKYEITKPIEFTPQFTATEIEKISDHFIEKLRNKLVPKDLYKLLGRMGKEKYSKNAFTAKIQRSLSLYGKPFNLGLEFHHHNYYQNAHNGFDIIDLYFVLKRLSNPYFPYSNPYGGRIVITLAAKNKKWQVVDINYRGFNSETGKRAMKKRLL
jgi:hypothetical protein